MPNKYKLGKTEYVKRHRKKIQALLDELKSVPCMDCGGIFPPICMDFDHVSGNKIRNVSGLTTCSIETVMLEVAKCEIICSNCHRIRTLKRGNYGKH